MSDTNTDFSSITVLINPASGSGSGAKVRPLVEQSIPENFSGATIDFVETKNKDHTLEIAKSCTSQLIICVGGDGSMHDLAQPLLQRPVSQRPCITILPVGSGNDYARTLGISLDPALALQQLANGQAVMADVGQVNNSYFLETLSFGVDAAVALNTEQLRLTTKTTGLRLYARAAVSAIIHELKPHRVRFSLDQKDYVDDLLILAIQNGQTYGSGFRVAPRASITDGQLDIYTASHIGTIQALYYLSQMKDGKHEQLKHFDYYKASQIELDLDTQVPIQCDGEQLFGTSFKISVLPAALPVYVPQMSPVLR